MGISVHNDNIPSKYSGIHWLSYELNDRDNSLLFTEMKIRRNN